MTTPKRAADVAQLCDHNECPGCSCPCHDRPGAVRGILYGLGLTAMLAVAVALGVWAWSIAP